MNQPPPHGWYQQPPPPPGWPQPPKKNRAPLVVGIIAGVLVLGAAATFGFLYLGANADGGSPKRGGTMPGVCADVPEAALAKARTTNGNPAMSRVRKLADHTQTSCAWDQTKGEDGSGLRNTDAYVVVGDAAAEYERRVSQSKQNNQGTISNRPLEGLGDEATAVLVDGKSAFLQIDVIVRKGDTVVEVEHTGWDAGLFGNKRPDITEFEAAARGVAEALLAQS
ncbi:hypothetical protein G7043_06395 [Lentzea sp. NEAU-D13]|uniref:DUF3558 domain-containing protein n=1 Tax=Lentzea alba TaxID=2714351 RepID=A0A7C9VT57_9PSEU|nr:hypothetical protein [Lentzea alba]NGY58558.1 hypothetical protein [Lentzea alba]